MPTPPLSDEKLREAVDALERYNGNQTAAANALGIARSTFQDRIRIARRREFADELKDATAEGFALKGYSEFTKTERGTPIWLKTVKAEQDYWQGVADAIRTIEPISNVPLPTGLPDGDIIPWLQIGDAHIGLLANEKETGANFDVGIAEAEICAAAAALIAGAPPCKRMVINDLGDGTHAETFAALTEASGHSLDVDTRYWKMIRSYIRITRFIIDRALEKAETVDYICNQGNHSRSNDIWAAALVEQIYGATGRVNVLENASVFIPYRMGKTMVVVHHGDKCRPEKFRDVVSSDYAIDWGETEFRYLDGGHVHHSQRKELAGCVFESWNNLAPRDKYANDGGWRSKQCMTLVLRSRTYGEVGRQVMPIERVRDLILATGKAHYRPPTMRAFAA
jgi:hypothetical protein